MLRQSAPVCAPTAKAGATRKQIAKALQNNEGDGSVVEQSFINNRCKMD
jgi:hypothetical protein